MNILIFIKQVADTEARVIIKSDQRSLEIENKYNMNFFDEFAVEEAVRIKEKQKDVQITVCTIGSQKAVEALRTAIAMGADRAFLIDGGRIAANDSLAIARVLAAFAKKEGFDMILCGRQAIDDESANVGAMASELLGIPHVSAILKMEIIDGNTVKVENEIEGGRGICEVKLPALFTAQKGLNEPRVPLITGVMKAMKASIPIVDPLSLGVPEEAVAAGASKVMILSYESPQERPPVKIIEGETPEEKVKNLIRTLKEDAKVL